MDPTRVLVTGGCGFLGTAIVSALLRSKRYSITVIDVNPPSLGSDTFTNSVRYVRCNIMDSSSLSSVFSEARPAVVIHTVGVFPLGTTRYSMRGKDAIFKINVEGTRNVVEASRECGAKAFVYTSSVTVVLDELDRDFRNVDERWPTGGVHTSYGQSKVTDFLFCCVSLDCSLERACSLLNHLVSCQFSHQKFSIIHFVHMKYCLLATVTYLIRNHLPKLWKGMEKKKQKLTRSRHSQNPLFFPQIRTTSRLVLCVRPPSLAAMTPCASPQYTRVSQRTKRPSS